jgi:hypothetical protein
MLIQHATIYDDDFEGNHERTLFSLQLEKLSDYPEKLTLPSPHFIVFLALDATAVVDQEILTLASRALSQGAIWFCVWGPDCERVHDLIDSGSSTSVSQRN